ncbi:hypothetical protein SuNHUV7_19800 (plasmid) [Pseudoseohaeicola sp. NH-UV-7]|jgi:DNA-binding MurR/RpiR family transcriptional regulator|uniref:MurR/RpiR family transcriptional regulator n=1 Tax=unclassified Sulfitobacter TaxID=196795 RepID=UPI000E0A0992|nr:MurR/RpiR family transcriptional regulator [Sulfitobacter sp. JL08]AXI56016.1 MurR/RpiR family transcriptional regulator [Sulfitobacter sp. JL08]
MGQQQSLQERVSERYSGLSGQLRKAADFVLANPLDIASRSLRAISSDSKVSPATFSRLARALGYATFEDMKEASRRSLGLHVTSLSDKAEKLRADPSLVRTMLQRQSEACIGNIRSFAAQTDEARLADVAKLMREARQVVLFGALASTGIAEYMAYLAHYFAPNWYLAGRSGDSLGSRIAALGQGDVVFIVTKNPFAQRAVIAARQARDVGADVILVTDSYKCPAFSSANYGFVVPSESPQFFSSYAVTLVLIETLIAMIVAGSEADATAAIQRVDAKNQELGEYWSE